MSIKLRKGTRVRIYEDVRQGALATGMYGKFVGYAEHKGWLLMKADGSPERESYNLPEGYVEWNPDKEDFPGVNCGIRAKDPVFLLEDGTKITGLQCYWGAVNPRIAKRLYNEAVQELKRLGFPESQIPSFEATMTQKR